LKAKLLLASSSSCFLPGFFPGATCRWHGHTSRYVMFHSMSEGQWRNT
jgi:hypothetical protein